MKKILLTFFGAFLLANCNNPQNNQVERIATIQENDTAQKDISTVDSLLEKVQNVYDDPYRVINNFEISFGDPFIDSLHKAYSEKGAVSFKKNICMGDNCESWKTIVNKKENATLYLFKGDGSEYGFSNDQFFLRNDSLAYVRNFTVGIDTWPTDSTNTKWKIEEVVYHFQDKVPHTTTRTVFTNALEQFDYTLRGVKAKISKDFNTEKLHQEKSLELKQLLEMKEIED
ncbi:MULTISPECIES: putative periplasmic lipoprotein [Niastella]|uniref:Lipoprotein n=1 Tax=Niastella soli TaxID=2821487 RepID=A0ABS3Z0Z6_9BACT|nr:hypothetical protein [Niastella soli]MBO9203350.1 hypothetical protein [Niastella soli]